MAPLQYRCRDNSCRVWFEKALGACPECGTEPYPINTWLRTASLNGHLLQTANAGHGESYKAARKAAKEILA